MAVDTVVPDAPERSLRTWLFNPFQYVAGGSALIIGVIVIAAAGLVGSLSQTHFDGVLDVHAGAPAALWFYVSGSSVEFVGSWWLR